MNLLAILTTIFVILAICGFSTGIAGSMMLFNNWRSHNGITLVIISALSWMGSICFLIAISIVRLTS